MDKLDILKILDSNENTSLSIAEMLRRTTYDELIELDTRNHSFRSIDHIQGKYRGITTEGSLDRFIGYSADHFIHPEDRELYLDTYGDMDRLRKKLDEAGGAFAVNIREKAVDGSWVSTRQLLISGTVMDLPSDLIYCFIYDVRDRRHRGTNSGVGTHTNYIGRKLMPDEITGLLVGFDFFSSIQNMIQEMDNGWCVIDVFIENFKLMIDWYGLEQGRYILSQIGELLARTAASEGGYAGYMGRESFCLVMRYDRQKIEDLYDSLRVIVSSVSMMDGFRPVMGISMIDGSLNYLQEYYNRADLTSTEIADEGKRRIRIYDTDMHKRNAYEYDIAYQFREAMEAGNISFWLQPQVRVSNGKLVGAEALARWTKEDGSMISPAVFVPVLEKYKLVTELDKFIWESVCRWLSEWKAKGHKSVPVSINVSQLDATALDLPEYIAKLLARYELTPSDIKIEFTETTLAEDVEAIHEAIRKLRDMGFRVMMDDFGSGYSSLNMLRKFSVDVIKLDAGFLSVDKEERDKGISILESVMNMTTRLATPIIAEGVEDKQQMIFLRDYGCRYMQGFYFYKPMPVAEFEELVADEGVIETNTLRFKANQQIRAREFFDENIYSDSMLNSILGPVAFYRWKGDNVDIIRYNEQFYEMVGIELEEMEERSLGIQEYIYPPDREKFVDLLRRASENYVVGARDVIRVYKPNGILVWLMIMVFYLSEDEDGKLFYASASDITDLQLVNSGLPGGYIRCAADDDYEFLHISNNMMDLVGYDSEEIKELFDNKLSNMIHPDDIGRLHRECEDIMAGKPDAVITPYRIKRKRGDYIYVAEQCILSDKFGALCWQAMLIDVTDVMKLRNQMFLLTEAYKSTVFFLHRENGTLVYDVVVNGLEKILGMDSDKLESFLNDGEFCHYVRGFNADIPHNEYTERFVEQVTGKQKKITVDLPGDRHIKLLVRADRVEDEKSDTEYILNLSLA